MKPIKFEGYNVTYTLDGCEDLPAKYAIVDVEGLGNVPVITSIWELDDTDIDVILVTKQIVFTIISEKQPPIMLRIYTPQYPE